MKIIEPSFEILNPRSRDEGILMLKKIEALARISHRAEDRATDSSWARFIRAVVVEKGDWSFAEHCYATVIVTTDRGITHEIVRHRLFSFTQESTRFVNYKKSDLEFIEPLNLTNTDQLMNTARWHWEQSLVNAEKEYLALVNMGVAPQTARSVLPNALAAKIAMTGNLRTWRHFFTMRTTKESHPDMKRISLPLLERFKELIPILYDDIIGNEKQSISLSRPK